MQPPEVTPSARVARALEEASAAACDAMLTETSPIRAETMGALARVLSEAETLVRIAKYGAHDALYLAGASLTDAIAKAREPDGEAPLLIAK